MTKPRGCAVPLQIPPNVATNTKAVCGLAMEVFSLLHPGGYLNPLRWRNSELQRPQPDRRVGRRKSLLVSRRAGLPLHGSPVLFHLGGPEYWLCQVGILCPCDKSISRLAPGGPVPNTASVLALQFTGLAVCTGSTLTIPDNP